MEHVTEHVTLPQAAKILGVSVSTLRYRRKNIPGWGHDTTSRGGWPLYDRARVEKLAAKDKKYLKPGPKA